jgi:hypothetical protein
LFIVHTTGCHTVIFWAYILVIYVFSQASHPLPRELSKGLVFSAIAAHTSMYMDTGLLGSLTQVLLMSFPGLMKLQTSIHCSEGQ